MPLARGLRPLDPRLPTPVGLGFANVLGPTRGGVTPSNHLPEFSPFPRREGGQGVRSERHIPQTHRQRASPMDPVTFY